MNRQLFTHLFPPVLLVAAACVFTGGCTRQKAPATPVEATKPRMPGSVRVVVDTSASMRGYFEGSTDLKDNVAQLAASLDKMRTSQTGLQSLQYDLLGDRGAIEPIEVDTHNFIEQMRSNHLMQHHDSLLQNAFENIVRTTDANNVTLLVSDSIVSYPDADVRANRRINVDNEASLGSEVETIFAQARARGLAAVVLASLSSFHGTYFDYQNRRTACCAGKRPYYVWVIGQSELVQTIVDFLQAGNVQSEHQISFSQASFKPDSAVLQTFARRGMFYRVRSDQRAIEIKGAGLGSPIQFGLALDLSRLPPPLQESEFLSTHLHAACPSAAVHVVAVQRRDEVQGAKDNDAPTLMPSYTHVVTLSLGPNVPNGAVIEVSLDSALPTWYRSWSNDDDSQTADARQPTTFGLRYLIEGVARAYGNSNDKLASTTITVKR